MEPGIDPSSAASPVVGGKACTNCSRVKCKCIYRTEGGSCERCHRLKKPCIPSTSIRKRSTKHKAVSRAARLEEKFDDLVVLLKTQQVVGQVKQGESPRASTSEQDQVQGDAETPSNELATPRNTFDSGSATGTGTLSADASTPATTLSYCNEPSPLVAEECLKRFRDEALTFFPYVHIPAGITSQQLRERQPFLWLNIMSVASDSLERRMALGDESRRTFIQRVVVEREKSIDLLLGLLVFLAWSHLQRKDKPYLSLYSQFAVALVFDLGLHKAPPDTPEPSAAPNKACSGGGNAAPPLIINSSFSDEERRAVLGAFAITSIISHSLATDGLRWSPHLDACLSYLDQSNLLPQDEILVAQVRMQLLLDTISRSPWPANAGGPPVFYTMTLQSQLQDIKDHMGPKFRNHPLILSQYHYIQLLIYTPVVKSKPPIQSYEIDARRFEAFQGCLSSVKAWFNTFFSASCAPITSLTFAFFSQFFYIIITLRDLKSDNDPVYYSDAVADVFDLGTTLDDILSAFAKLWVAAGVTPLTGADTITCKGKRLVQNMRMARKHELAPLGAAVVDDSNQASPHEVQQDAPSPDELLAMSMDLASDAWFSDAFNFAWD